MVDMSKPSHRYFISCMRRARSEAARVIWGVRIELRGRTSPARCRAGLTTAGLEDGARLDKE